MLFWPLKLAFLADVPLFPFFHRLSASMQYPFWRGWIKRQLGLSLSLISLILLPNLPLLGTQVSEFLHLWFWLNKVPLHPALRCMTPAASFLHLQCKSLLNDLTQQREKRQDMFSEIMPTAQPWSRETQEHEAYVQRKKKPRNWINVPYFH